MNSKTLKLILEVAVKITEAGGEISRVEESVERVCGAYGSLRTDVYATTSNIIASVEVADGEVITQARNVDRINTNIEKLDRLNAIVRWMTETSPDELSVRRRLIEADNVKTPSTPLALLYFGVVACAFCVFFGCREIYAIISSFVLGMAVGGINEGLEHIRANKILIKFVCCTFAAFMIRGLVQIGLFPSPDHITIGIIMTLIPGSGITNALRDLFSGDIVTGILRTIEAILTATAMAVGFALPGILLGGAL